MNFKTRVRSHPIAQSMFVIGSMILLLLATAGIRYYTVVDRFTNENEAASVINRYTAVEIALLLISIGLFSFIWLVLLQGRMANPIRFNFRSGNAVSENLADPARTMSRPQVEMEMALIEQNRYLTQALDVGRELLNTTDLEGLLASAVEEIQKKFDLYHVQIYLCESSGRTLTLRSGSGRIGTELVRRGHRLAIGTGSINGTAAQREETVLVADTSHSDLFLANALLNRTRSEMSVPLLASGQLLGVLNLQSIYINGVNNTLQKAIEGLAPQLAIAIDHANRIAELEEAQQTVAEQAARLTRTGWKNWLESLENGAELTYLHQPTGGQQPAADPDKIEQNMFMASSIMVSGAEVGNIHIETDTNRHWGMEDIDLVRAVADQLGQKIENLRLLSESDRYREEAEVALRQLTRENWGEFTEQLEAGGYRFDGNSIDSVSHDMLETLDTGESLELTIQGEEVGTLAVDQAISNPGDKELLEAIAGSLSGHLENLRLNEQTKRQVFELALLNRVNSAMSAQLDLYDLIEIVGEELRNGFSASGTFISIYNRETNMMEYPFFVLDGKDGVRRVDEQPRTRGKGFSSQVIQSGKPLMISRNPAEMIRAGALVVDYGDMPHSYLGVPIIFGDNVLGVLSLQNGPERRLFNEHDQELVVSIASSMALVLQNSSLFQETQSALEVSEQRRLELQAINSVVADTTSAVAVEEAIDRMAQKLIEIMEGEQVCTTLLESNQQELVIVSERDENGVIQDLIGTRFDIESFPDQKMVLNSQKLFKSAENVDDDGSPRLVILPIIGQSGAIGTVRLTQKDGEKGFSESQINLAETIVYQVSTVLENKQLLSETRKRALREQKVRTITDRIRRGTDQREILRIAQEELSNMIGARKARSWMGSSEKLVDHISGEPALVSPEEKA